MLQQFRNTVVLAVLSGLCAHAQLVAGAAPPAGPPTGDHPSNGVVEMIVTPAPAPHGPHKLGDPPEEYTPWDGVLSVRIKNVSLGPARVEEGDWLREYTVEILDSSGKPVPTTEHGKSAVEEASRPRSPYAYAGPGAFFSLAPGENTYREVDLSKTYQVESGKAYTIKIRRSAGLPKVDEHGRPIQQRELSCTVTIDEKGVHR